ncbi:hypothetical protein FN976_07955 [Caenimonas sedimenti]|uniref:Uncharacterized protein n=1 Tax=Caenimonas sedimenti TaxID=2596921 RepID=A0A562ZUD5_9BURK|nr:hypothetical protein [Caenimonas sedimenti]TWO71915.1 hypothetical protein FN976_07955 [Caenimonas sedimenti]
MSDLNKTDDPFDEWKAAHEALLRQERLVADAWMLVRREQAPEPQAMQDELMQMRIRVDQLFNKAMIYLGSPRT